MLDETLIRAIIRRKLKRIYEAPDNDTNEEEEESHTLDDTYDPLGDEYDSFPPPGPSFCPNSP